MGRWDETKSASDRPRRRRKRRRRKKRKRECKPRSCLNTAVYALPCGGGANPAEINILRCTFNVRSRPCFCLTALSRFHRQKQIELNSIALKSCPVDLSSTTPCQETLFRTWRTQSYTPGLHLFFSYRLGWKYLNGLSNWNFGFPYDLGL